MGQHEGFDRRRRSSQTNEPPAWAKPLLEKVASEAMGMYNSGQGYNVYRGPTQANFSPQRLEGLNRAMMMTGSTGPKITNESIFQTDQVKQIQGMIGQQQVAEEQRARPQPQPQPRPRQPRRKLRSTEQPTREQLVGGRGGDRGSSG